MDTDHEPQLRRAAAAVDAADALVIGAGAGMGVDSGLPDFRGSEGFWRAYPPYAKLGLSFTQLASPRWFREDPELAWGFYGHRLHLYRDTVPHAGFAVLKRWGEAMRLGSFVYTSNIDGQFQRAGFDPDRVLEVHGAIDWLQCLVDCGAGLFPADGTNVTIDPKTMRAVGDLPRCPGCGVLARPNILMFGDGSWDSSRTDDQRGRFEDWLHGLAGAKVVAVECGAGTAIPTVRRFCEAVASSAGGTLVRLNVREPEIPRGQVGLPLGALEALRAIDVLRAG